MPHKDGLDNPETGLDWPKTTGDHVNQPASSSQPLTLRFAHNVIEHLGLKLYQNKPTNVLAELVSNSWDAMAPNVFIDLDLSGSGTPTAISVFDDGRGMSKC